MDNDSLQYLPRYFTVVPEQVNGQRLYTLLVLQQEDENSDAAVIFKKGPLFLFEVRRALQIQLSKEMQRLVSGKDSSKA